MDTCISMKRKVTDEEGARAKPFGRKSFGTRVRQAGLLCKGLVTIHGFKTYESTRDAVNRNEAGSKNGD